MKKRALTAVCTAAALLPAVGFTGCGNFNQTNLTQTNEKGEIIAYSGEQQEDGQTFSKAANVDDKYLFYYFYLGTVYDVPIYTSTIFEYQFDTEVTISFDSLTSETLSKSLEQTQQTVETKSLSSGMEIGFRQEVSAEGNIAFAKIKGTAGFSQDFDVRKSKEWSDAKSEAVSTSDSYLKKYEQGYSKRINFNEAARFKLGYSYRMVFYNSVNAYGVLAYDIANKTYSPLNDFLLESNGLIRKWEESKDGRFVYEQKKSLSFDVNRAIEYAEANKDELIGTTEPEPGEETDLFVYRINIPGRNEAINISGPFYEGIKPNKMYVNVKGSVYSQSADATYYFDRQKVELHSFIDNDGVFSWYFIVECTDGKPLEILCNRAYGFEGEISYCMYEGYKYTRNNIKMRGMLRTDAPRPAENYRPSP